MAAEAPPGTAHRAKLGDRSLFPELDARAYLNHAAISPTSIAVRDQVRAVLDDYARGGLEGFMRWRPQRARLKESLAYLIGASADEIALVPNTTSGVIQIAHGLDWQWGERVVLFEREFPANVTPWQRAAATFGLEVTFLPVEPFHRSIEEGLAGLEEALSHGARLVAVSAVQFQTGLRMPVPEMAALCQSHGAELFVDAIQGLGAVPFDVSGVDYVASGGHKWLMGPEGAGMLYVRRERARRLMPRLAGWLSHENALDFLFLGEGHLRHDRPIRRTADFVEPGGVSALGYAGLEASLDLIAQLGVSAVFAHVQSYHDALEPALEGLGLRSLRAAYPSGRSATLSFAVPSDVAVTDLHRALGERSIACSIPDGHLRFAPHWPNHLSEVPFIAGAVDDALRALRSG